jgi:hypothetical protein
VTTIAPIDEDLIFTFRLSTTPSVIVYDAPGNNDGHNPNHRWQIQRIGFAGTGYLRITADPIYDSFDPHVSGDGTKIVWWSQADFTGQNPDHNWEIFLYDASIATKRQLTDTTGDSGSVAPAITRDGAWVYYFSYAAGESRRVSVATGEVQRVTGLPRNVGGFADADATGTKTLFVGRDAINRSQPSLYLADQTAKATFPIGKAAPTLLDWDPDPQSASYDVIRGDLANLSIAGSTVSLGPVACIEDDSPDNRTLGSEDATQPDPGHGFFYLYRGTTGVPPVAASWGQGTGARERTAGSGSCSP